MGFIQKIQHFLRRSPKKPTKTRIKGQGNRKTSPVTPYEWAKRILTVGSLITGAVIVLAGAGQFSYLLFTSKVFVEDVDIAQSLQGRGAAGGSLTEEALASMEIVAARRITALSRPDVQLMHMMERKAANLESDRVCNLEIATLEPAYDVYLKGLKLGLLSNTVPDKASSALEESLRKTAFWTREILGWDARVLRPLLHVDAEGKPFVSVRSTPVVGEPLSKPVEDLGQAGQVLASLLVDYLSPEILALEMLNDGANNYRVPWLIANIFLQDDQIAFRISVATSSRLLEASRSTADTWDWYSRFEDYNRRLLKELDFSAYGDSAAFVKLTVAQRLAATERLKKQRRGERIDQSALFDAYVKPYSKELEKSIPGEITLLVMDAKYGRKQEFERRLHSLLDRVQILRIPGVRGVITRDNIAFLGLSMMLAVGDIPAAKRFVASERFEKWIPENRFQEAGRQALLAVLEVAEGNLIKYRTLVGLDFFKNPCAEYLLVGQIGGLNGAGLVDYSKNKPLLDLVRNSFSRLEKSGIKSFEFYEQWANLERISDNPKGAMALHEKALKFEGQHSWALLNWAGKALDLKELDVAREKYAASLKINVIPNAVDGYLRTLALLNESEEYLDSFNKYGPALSDFDVSRRSLLEAHALVVACNLGRVPKISLLAPGQSIVIEGKSYRFEKSSCNMVPLTP